MWARHVWNFNGCLHTHRHRHTHVRERNSHVRHFKVSDVWEKNLNLRHASTYTRTNTHTHTHTHTQKHTYTHTHTRTRTRTRTRTSRARAHTHTHTLSICVWAYVSVYVVNEAANDHVYDLHANKYNLIHASIYLSIYHLLSTACSWSNMPIRIIWWTDLSIYYLSLTLIVIIIYMPTLMIWYMCPSIYIPIIGAPFNRPYIPWKEPYIPWKEPWIP